MKATMLMLLLAVALTVAGCQSPKAVTDPGANPVASLETHQAGEIVWLTDLDQALAQAKQWKKPLLVDFNATWCGPCQMMEKTTWKDAKVAVASADFVMVKQDVDKFKAVAEKFKIDSVPTMLFMGSDGKVKHQQVGGIDAEEMLKLMKQYK